LEIHTFATSDYKGSIRQGFVDKRNKYGFAEILKKEEERLNEKTNQRICGETCKDRTKEEGSHLW
jgi:hypothetical protein